MPPGPRESLSRLIELPAIGRGSRWQHGVGGFFPRRESTSRAGEGSEPRIAFPGRPAQALVPWGGAWLPGSRKDPHRVHWRWCECRAKQRVVAFAGARKTCQRFTALLVACGKPGSISLELDMVGGGLGPTRRRSASAKPSYEVGQRSGFAVEPGGACCAGCETFWSTTEVPSVGHDSQQPSGWCRERFGG